MWQACSKFCEVKVRALSVMSAVEGSLQVSYHLGSAPSCQPLSTTWTKRVSAIVQRYLYYCSRYKTYKTELTLSCATGCIWKTTFVWKLSLYNATNCKFLIPLCTNQNTYSLLLPPSIPPLTHSLAFSHNQSFMHSLTLFTDAVTNSPIPLITPQLINLLIHSLTQSNI